jgi:threonine/homoserine/homoserine lactone efflux protein
MQSGFAQTSNLTAEMLNRQQRAKIGGPSELDKSLAMCGYGRQGKSRFESWLAFAAASAILLVIPGPTVLLLVSYALGQGWRTALPTAVGVALGDFTAMTLSMLGVGALLATSAILFTALKWVGPAYLAWLGIKLWQAGGSLKAVPRTDKVPVLKVIGHAWVVTALNPKSITFFVAFLSQFLSPKSNFLAQMIVFETTFLLLAFANAFGYALIASRARALVQSARAISIFNKAGGTLLIGAGVAAATVRTAQN